MEETMVSPLMSDALNFLALGLSVVLLFAVAYLWSSNNTKTAELKQLQEDMRRVKKNLSTVEEKVNQIREPTVVADVQQAAPFGIDLSDVEEDDDLSQPLSLKISPKPAPPKPWLKFIEEYNKFSSTLAAPGELRKCEKFVQENKLKILSYSGTMNFRHAIDVKDSSYWAFKCPDDEYAVVPNPMVPCDEELHEHGGIKEIYALNYQSGVYRKYFVKLPAIFTQDQAKGWTFKDAGVVNLERN